MTEFNDTLDEMLDKAGAEEGVEHEYQPNVEAAVINAVSTDIGLWAKGHGFREGWEMADKLDELSERLDVAGHVRLDEVIGDSDLSMLLEAAKLMRTLWLGNKLMLVVTEAAEAMETLRKVGAEGVVNGEGNFGEELADAMVRIGDLSHNVGSPLGDEVMKKVAINATRPYKHGKKM